MITRPRCRHCDRILMLGERWVEAAPRVFQCEAHVPSFDPPAPPRNRGPAEAAAAMMG